MCGLTLCSHLPDCVAAITGAVLVTDEAVKARGTEPLLAIRAFKACFTDTGSIDMVTLGAIVTLTLLVTLRAVGADRTVVLTPAKVYRIMASSLNWCRKKKKQE